ncbi:hypothetical protein AAES_136005 [Amazona aestiva]|uniref:Uncharacterized protein n=1 Tax=Amazona aestiva TaxID=12930 RepID=A0A0Q3P6I2_AMAAE|nr:hypothetical protein AAES_136005 [Amazona aestiva]
MAKLEHWRYCNQMDYEDGDITAEFVCLADSQHHISMLELPVWEQGVEPTLSEQDAWERKPEGEMKNSILVKSPAQLVIVHLRMTSSSLMGVPDDKNFERIMSLQCRTTPGMPFSALVSYEL